MESLLFAGEALHEVVVAGTLDGDGPAGGVFERVEIIEDLVTDGRLLQVTRGVHVLLVDESAGLRALCIFKPAVVVGDFGAGVIVDDRLRINCGRSGESETGAAANGLRGSDCAEHNERRQNRQFAAFETPCQTEYSCDLSRNADELSDAPLMPLAPDFRRLRIATRGDLEAR